MTTSYNVQHALDRLKFFSRSKTGKNVEWLQASKRRRMKMTTFSGAYAAIFNNPPDDKGSFDNAPGCRCDRDDCPCVRSEKSSPAFDCVQCENCLLLWRLAAAKAEIERIDQLLKVFLK